MKSVHFRKIFYPFLAFLFGIAVTRRIFNVDIIVIVTVGLVLSVAACLMILSKRFMALAAVLVCFFLGQGAFFLGLATYNTGKVYPGESVVVARVSDDMTEYDTSERVLLKNAYINGEKVKNISLYIYIDDDSRINAGDVVSFRAEVEKVELFDGGDFKSYFLRDNVGYSAVTSTSRIEVLDNFLTFDESFRQGVKGRLYANMSEENAGICYAVLLGDKSGLEDEVDNIYRGAGIIHILTVSGLHVGFLITLIYFVLRLCRLGRLSTTIITSVALLLYNILCGFSPAIVRASVMALIVMLAKLSGREYDGLNALGLAGFLILIVSPLYAFDLGFLMSFFSVTAIYMLVPVLTKGLKKIMNYRVASLLALSLSAEFGILPFLAEMKNRFNFLSPFANLIIVPLFGLIYPFLFISMLLTAIFPFLSKIFVIFDKLFDFLTAIARFFAGTVLKVQLLPFPLPVIVAMALLCFFVSRYYMKK